MNTNATNESTEGLLSRAAAFRVLAGGAMYPDAQFKQGLLQELSAVIGSAPAPGPVQTTALAKLERAWAGVDEDSLIEEYSRLFIGGDAIVLHETAYGNTGRSAELADINGFYLAFDFDLREGQHEVADHLGMELEFYSLLLLKQAYALEQGWQDKFDIARAAAKAFLADHLGRWVDTVRERAAERQAAPAYGILFETIAELVQHECQTLMVQPAPLICGGPDFMQAASFVCPMEQASAATHAGGAASTNELK
ncbi:MAG: molecular chaperone TorD family protein [Sulfuricaulis sp.]|nr:molecular chaperone TorD family protein [Sulfuricaulis sp.]